MGAFDQFKDKAGEVADDAEEQLGNRRGKSAPGSENSENPQRGGMQDELQERASDARDQARERMGRDGRREQDEWDA
jgi:hypothetical protein